MLMLLTAVFLSLDALVLGFAYGINGTRLSRLSFICMNGTALFVTYVTYFAGCVLDIFLNEVWGSLTGSLMLIGIGIYIAAKGTGDCQNDQSPDCSDNISALGAAVTGVVLSADAAAVCTGLAVGEAASCIMPLVICLVQGGFMYAGIFAGRKTGIGLNEKLMSLITGMAILLYGLYQLTPVFCR